MKKKNDGIEVKEVTQKKEWEDFNLSREYPSYFQSWTWGEVQKRAKVPVFRFGFFKKGKLFAIAQLFEVRAKRGHYLHIRQGPVFIKWEKELIESVFDYIKTFAKSKNVSYIRISPLIKEGSEALSHFTSYGFRTSPIHNVDAENRWILHLDLDTSTLLSNMRKTTRYLIKKGDNSNIKITRSTKLNDLDKFTDLYKSIAKMKKFVPHSLVREEFEEYQKENKSFLYFATLHGRTLSCAMVIYYGRDAIYRHGATTEEGRKIPASYLIQWEAIKDAKKNDLSLYNFWGISKDDNPKNPWFGLSQFKKGFGGEQVDFIHSMDLTLRPTYWVSYAIDYFTKLKKGYLIVV